MQQVLLLNYFVKRMTQLQGNVYSRCVTFQRRFAPMRDGLLASLPTVFYACG